MLLFSRNRKSAGWPFWLLISAWFCANSPQAAVYEMVSWIGKARHFSHQQRLRAEVAFVLGEEKAPLFPSVVKAEPAKPFAPLVPAEAILKKIELAVQRTSGMLPPSRPALVRIERASLPPDTLRDQPPHEPPRAGLAG